MPSPSKKVPPPADSPIVAAARAELHELAREVRATAEKLRSLSGRLRAAARTAKPIGVAPTGYRYTVERWLAGCLSGGGTPQEELVDAAKSLDGFARYNWAREVQEEFESTLRAPREGPPPELPAPRTIDLYRASDGMVLAWRRDDPICVEFVVRVYETEGLTLDREAAARTAATLAAGLWVDRRRPRSLPAPTESVAPPVPA